MWKRNRLQTVVFWNMTLHNLGRGYCFGGIVQGHREQDGDAEQTIGQTGCNEGGR